MVKGHDVDRRPVTSVMPQGLVLRPLLFVVYINELDEDSEDGYIDIWQALDQLSTWTEEHVEDCIWEIKPGNGIQYVET